MNITHQIFSKISKFLGMVRVTVVPLFLPSEWNRNDPPKCVAYTVDRQMPTPRPRRGSDIG